MGDIERMSEIDEKLEEKRLYKKFKNKLLKDKEFLTVMRDYIKYDDFNIIYDTDEEYFISHDRCDITKEVSYDDYDLYCNVKEYLNKTGRTQKWLSSKTDIPQSTLSGIINNGNGVSLEYAFRISKAIGEPIEKLFKYEPFI